MAEQERDEEPRRWPAELARRWGLLAGDLGRRIGPGAPLEPGVRAGFEGRLAGDLSGTMVHRSPFAGHLAGVLGAAALSTRGHVLGDHQSLDPTTPGGAALLGHELAHVVQRSAVSADEQTAQVVERAVAAEAQAGPAAPAGVDLDALAERVYQRMMDQLRRENDRAAMVT